MQEPLPYIDSRSPEDIVGEDMFDVDPLSLKKQISSVKWDRQPLINKDQVMNDNQLPKQETIDANDMTNADFWKDAVDETN